MFAVMVSPGFSQPDFIAQDHTGGNGYDRALADRYFGAGNIALQGNVHCVYATTVIGLSESDNGSIGDGVTTTVAHRCGFEDHTRAGSAGGHSQIAGIAGYLMNHALVFN